MCKEMKVSKGIEIVTYKDLQIRNKQLEQENTELKSIVQNTKAVDESYAKLQQENAELKNRNQELLQSCEGATMMYKDLQKAKEIIKELLCNEQIPRDCLNERYRKLLEDAEQFLNNGSKSESEPEEPYYVIMNMNCQYEICRRCPKSGLFKGTYEECENWIKEKLNEEN